MRYPHLFLCLALAATVHAQQAGCGTDAYAALHASPARTAAQERLDRLVLQAAELRGTGYTVPVVFHLVHDNGPEDVADSVLALALDRLNLRFLNTAPFHDTTGHVVPITFCRASVDPFGQITTGITRHQSPLTVHAMAQGNAVKNLVRWDPYRYLNVWVVRTITDWNTDGYSSFPWDLGATHDGVVIEAQYVANGHLFAHEVGHYLGLYHTFQGYCWNYNCQLDGDHVCDTPPDDSNWSTCLELRCNSETQDTTGLSPFTGDVPELPNYMDYSGCPRSFSQGQSDRMTGFMFTARTALNTSYGCGTIPYGPPPVASVLVDSSDCTGRVTFTNTTPGADFVQWDLGADGWDAVANTFTVDFDSSGTYTLLAAIGTAQGTDTVALSIPVRVGPTPLYPIVAGLQNLFIDPWDQLPTACFGDTLTLEGAPGMIGYTWSTGATTPTLTWPVTGPFHVRLTAVDSTGLAWTNCAYDTINVHLMPPFANQGDDTLHCGEIVSLALDAPGFPASYTWYHNGAAFSGPTLDYWTYLWDLGLHQYAVRLGDNVGCLLWTDTLDVTLLPTVPPVISQVGNDLVLDHGVMNSAWYHDGVAVPNQNQVVLPNAAPGCYWIYGYDCAPVYSDTFCLLPTGLAGLATQGHVLYPVPANDHLWLRPAPPANALAVVLDAAGRIVLRPSAVDLREGLPLTTLPPGAYTLVLTSGTAREALPFARVP